MHEVVVIDYGLGNLLSICRGLEYCGASVKITKDHQTILKASRVIFPGVGSFPHGMAELKNQGLDSILREVIKKEIKILGICLGMQLLLDESEEFELTAGLGFIPGRVIPIPSYTRNGQTIKIPHTGWNELLISSNTSNGLLKNIKQGESTYFVHSFMAVPKNQEDRFADCMYGENRIAAVIGNKNIFGCQFHPEKSGEVGLRILKNFLSI